MRNPGAPQSLVGGAYSKELTTSRGKVGVYRSVRGVRRGECAADGETVRDYGIVREPENKSSFSDVTTTIKRPSSTI